MDNTYQNEVEAPQADALQPEKKKRSKLLRVLVGVVAVSLIGAGIYFGKDLLDGGGSATPDGSLDVQYLPFQAEADGDWGLISPDGEVLFADEFKEQPTIATNDRFFVKNSDGLWEMYTATEKPQKVGDEYVSICTFARGCDVTPAVRKDKGVEFIDKDGNVKFKFDEVNGKKVESCSSFNAEGQAVFSIDYGELNGVVNTKGNIVIKPKYGLIQSYGGYFYAIEQPLSEIGKDYTWKLLDQNGKEICSYKSSKYFSPIPPAVPNTYRGTFMVDNKIAVRSLDDETGIIDKDGNVVLKPSKKFFNIDAFDGTTMIYANSDTLCGARTIDGEDIVRAKYKQLLPMKDFSGYFAKKEKDEGWILLNEKGERIGTEEYDSIIAAPWSKIFVQMSKNDWGLIDKKGNEIKLKQNIAKVACPMLTGDVMAEDGPAISEKWIHYLNKYQEILADTKSKTVATKNETELIDVMKNYFNNIGLSILQYRLQTCSEQYQNMPKEQQEKEDEKFKKERDDANERCQKVISELDRALYTKITEFGITDMNAFWEKVQE